MPKRGGEAALQQMQEQANMDLTAALAVKVNQLFASFNQKFEANRREETRKADEAIMLTQEKNAALRRQMLAMEAARLEQDRKMWTVLEGIMTRLGAGPLSLAEVMTPPRGDDTSQRWDRTVCSSGHHVSGVDGKQLFRASLFTGRRGTTARQGTTSNKQSPCYRTDSGSTCASGRGSERQGSGGSTERNGEHRWRGNVAAAQGFRTRRCS